MTFWNQITQVVVPALIAIGLLILVILFVRGFRNFSLRTKVIVGILTTGGLAIGVLAFFAFERASEIVTSLSGRLETNVSLLAEEQLVNSASAEAGIANQFFDDVMDEVTGMARYRVSLQSQQQVLSQGVYWNAATKLIRFNGGQYGNSASDVSSVFVPATVELNDAVLAELNTSAYLDFSAPRSIEKIPAILAIYYIDRQGVVRYYPNIELASLLPPDFNATTRPYYEITSPLFNLQRETRWTIPYMDAAGGGLVVTVASPVYYGAEFNGVVAADIQLSRITEQASAIKVGQTGYAFILDNAGRVISMPREGYEIFGITPKDLSAADFFRQTILGQGPEDLNTITYQMVAGGQGLKIVQLNGVDTYVSYAPIKANGYSLALVVPVAEMQSAIAVARSETQTQSQSAIRTALLILSAMLLGAVLISLAIGQVIAAPVRRLTETAHQIVAGDLSARAAVNSRDEIGVLAQAFNAMTFRLRETLEGLEHIVAERTAELVAANQRNERRAKQFESIAQVARAITSTRELDALLTQITTVISREFGFYHFGVFLLDTAKEYAVLSTANSEGGQNMLARGHRLKVGETGLVGYVTGAGTARVALDTGADAVFFNNPDLPMTRSEIVLPLLAGGEVIGALDAQSAEPNAFDQEDINILTTLADQVSVAIQNARQYEQTQKALAESEALSRQFVQLGWSEFTRTQKIEGIRHTGAKSTLLYKRNGKGAGKRLPDTKQLTAKGRGAILSLPLKLRGEVIGSVDVRAPENRQWDQDELDVVKAIIERAAVAMENARLLTESQKRAAKERTIGEIASRMSAQSDIDELLKTAARELNRAMPGAEIAVQFKRDRESE